MNRWYVRSEDGEVAEILAPEPNPLLDGKPRRWWEVERERELIARMEELDAAARASADGVKVLRAEANALREEFVDLRSQLDLIQGSKSWRLTAPLRGVRRAARRK